MGIYGHTWDKYRTINESKVGEELEKIRDSRINSNGDINRSTNKVSKLNQNTQQIQQNPPDENEMDKIDREENK